VLRKQAPSTLLAQLIVTYTAQCEVHVLREQAQPTLLTQLTDCCCWLQICVAVVCTYAQCAPESQVYHQNCIEKYLKGLGLDK
jgi:hypothetical protein